MNEYAQDALKKLEHDFIGQRHFILFERLFKNNEHFDFDKTKHIQKKKGTNSPFTTGAKNKKTAKFLYKLIIFDF